MLIFFYGTLKNEIFESFTSFQDEDVHYDYPELNDHFVKLEVDRIDVSFFTGTIIKNKITPKQRQLRGQIYSTRRLSRLMENLGKSKSTGPT